jgi:hypothetical protein
VIGLVLANAGLIEDRRASRQRLVTAQDEARRRLERNLRDGAQQDLSWPWPSVHWSGHLQTAVACVAVSWGLADICGPMAFAVWVPLAGARG